MTNLELPSEHHLRFHRRQWVIYLLACIAMAAGTVVRVLIPEETTRPLFPLHSLPTFGLFALMILLSLVERVRHRAEFEREKKRIWTDEWTLRGLNRAQGIAMLTMIFAQVPLAFFMAYVPREPSVVGMCMMTGALGAGTWAATYLYFTREPR